MYCRGRCLPRHTHMYVCHRQRKWSLLPSGALYWWEYVIMHIRLHQTKLQLECWSVECSVCSISICVQQSVWSWNRAPHRWAATISPSAIQMQTAWAAVAVALVTSVEMCVGWKRSGHPPVSTVLVTLDVIPLVARSLFICCYCSAWKQRKWLQNKTDPEQTPRSIQHPELLQSVCKIEASEYWKIIIDLYGNWWKNFYLPFYQALVSSWWLLFQQNLTARYRKTIAGNYTQKFQKNFCFFSERTF